MNNIWDSVVIGKSYMFDMEYLNNNSRRTEMIEGTVKDKLIQSDGRHFIVLNNNSAVHLEQVSRLIGPF